MARKGVEAERKAAAARRRGERLAARERVRVGDVSAATGSTRERAAKTSPDRATWSGRREAKARIAADLPKVVRELFQRGQLDEAHLRAAERYIGDYRFGMCQPGMTQRWERGVDGRTGGDESERRLDARRRFMDMDKSLGMVRQVVFGVLLGGVTLEAADGPGQRYSSGTNRRVGNGAALYLGLDQLACLYALKEPG